MAEKLNSSETSYTGVGDAMIRFPVALARTAANLMAASVFLAAFVSAGARSIADYRLVFFSSPLEIVPPGCLAQIELVRHYVPHGAILYLTDAQENWQRGLWQRTLYPDYPVITAFGMKHFQSPAIQQLIQKDNIQYVLSAGNPPLDPGFEWKMALPPYIHGVPIVLGRLHRE